MNLLQKKYRNSDFDMTIGSLCVEICEDYFFAGNSTVNFFWFDIGGPFEVNHFDGFNRYKPFDIMKHISFKDKI